MPLCTYVTNCDSHGRAKIQEANGYKKFMFDCANPKAYINKIVNVINYFPSLGIYHEDSQFCQKSENCPWAGVSHVHWISDSTPHARMGEFYPFKQASKFYKDFEGRYYPTCVINNLEAMARYFSDSPREVIGMNSKYSKVLTDFHDAIQQYGKEHRSTTLVPSPPHKLSNDEKNIRQLIQLMDVYWIVDNDSYLHAIRHMNSLEKKIAFELQCKGTFDHWFLKAKTISKVNDKQKHTRQLMFEKLISKDTDEKFMTIGDSLYHLVNWCNYHRIQLRLFIEQVKTILEGNSNNSTIKNKQNCLCLQGPSNAGKT